MQNQAGPLSVPNPNIYKKRPWEKRGRSFEAWYLSKLESDVICVINTLSICYDMLRVHQGARNKASSIRGDDGVKELVSMLSMYHQKITNLVCELVQPELVTMILRVNEVVVSVIGWYQSLKKGKAYNPTSFSADLMLAHVLQSIEKVRSPPPAAKEPTATEADLASPRAATVVKPASRQRQRPTRRGAPPRKDLVELRDPPEAVDQKEDPDTPTFGVFSGVKHGTALRTTGSTNTSEEISLQTPPPVPADAFACFNVEPEAEEGNPFAAFGGADGDDLGLFSGLSMGAADTFPLMSVAEAVEEGDEENDDDEYVSAMPTDKPDDQSVNYTALRQDVNSIFTALS